MKMWLKKGCTLPGKVICNEFVETAHARTRTLEKWVTEDNMNSVGYYIDGARENPAPIYGLRAIYQSRKHAGDHWALADWSYDFPIVLVPMCPDFEYRVIDLCLKNEKILQHCELQSTEIHSFLAAFVKHLHHAAMREQEKKEKNAVE